MRGVCEPEGRVVKGGYIWFTSRGRSGHDSSGECLACVGVCEEGKCGVARVVQIVYRQ